MKEPQLYSLVKDYVEKKKLSKYKPVPNIIAPDFYNSEMKKRKLIPKNPQTKMKKIFQMFQGLDSFVNVTEIVRAYEKLNRSDSAKSLTKKPFNYLTSSLEPEFDGYISRKQRMQKDRILEKVDEKLKNFYQHHNYLKNNKCEGILRNLQRTSSKVKSQNRPNPSTETQFLLDQIEKQEKFQKQKNKIQPDPQDQPQPLPENTTIPIDYTSLVHKASTYLHIVLENEHRKKWKPNKRYETQYSGERRRKYSKTGRPEILARKTARLNFHKMGDSVRRRNNKKRLSACKIGSSQCCDQERLMLRKSLNKIFTFKKRKIKEVLMEKIGEFMMRVEELEKILQKQNKYYLEDIQKLKKYIESEYEKFDEEQLLSLDEKLNKIRQIATKNR